MSGPRRRKFVGPLVSRVTWHGGRGSQRSRWALLIALVLVDHQLGRNPALLRLGRAPVAEGSEADGLDSSDLDALFDEEAPHGVHSTLAQVVVVVARSLRVRIPDELDG